MTFSQGQFLQYYASSSNFGWLDHPPYQVMHTTPPSQTLSERVFSMRLVREVEDDLNKVVVRFGVPTHVEHSDQRQTNKQIWANKYPDKNRQKIHNYILSF